MHFCCAWWFSTQNNYFKGASKLQKMLKIAFLAILNPPLKYLCLVESDQAQHKCINLAKFCKDFFFGMKKY